MSILLAAFMAFSINSEFENKTAPKYALEVVNYSLGMPSYDYVDLELPSPCNTSEDYTFDLDTFELNGGPTCSDGTASCNCNDGQCCNAGSGECACTECDSRSRLGRLLDRIL